MEWHPVFVAGRTRVQVPFTGGHLCGGACTAASYATDDPVVQKIIETSALFLSGRIQLVESSEEIPDPPNRQVKTKAENKPPLTTTTTIEFDNVVKAQDFLHLDKGIPMDDILDAAECIAAAAKLGLDLKIKG